MTQENTPTAAPPAPPSGLKLWLLAARPFSFTASVVPVLVGALAGFASQDAVAWPLLAPVLIAAVLVHAGTNLFNDTHDYDKGVDREGTLGGSGMIVAGQLTSKQTNRAALLCFAVVLALGVWFIVLRGWPIALLGGLGLLGGYAYTGRPVGYKYIALGDPMVFALMGPLMVIGADIVLTGAFHWATLWISLPVGFLVMSILHGNNLRDLEDDRQSGFRTIAMLIGAPAARAWYGVQVLAAFAAAAALIALQVLPLWSIAVILALPAALKNIVRVSRQTRTGDPLADIDVRSAQVHMQFGVLLTLSILVGALIR